MKYYHYISKSKVEMLLPQVRRTKFSLKLSPKVEVAGISVSSDVEKQDDAALVSQLTELIEKMEKKKLIQDVNLSIFIRDDSFLRGRGTWRHGLFYFKGGVPRFPGDGEKEGLLIITVIYVAWTIIGDAIIFLVGSPNNVLGDKVAPDGLFMPGTGGVQDAVRTLINSLGTDEPIAVTKEGSRSESISLPNIQVGSRQQYTRSYGEELMPLPGFGGEALFPLSLARFCLDYLTDLPQANLETVFRVLSTYKSKQDNFQLDLEHFSENNIFNGQNWSEQWEKIRQTAEQKGLGQISKVYFGSPIYTALM